MRSITILEKRNFSKSNVNKCLIVLFAKKYPSYVRQKIVKKQLSVTTNGAKVDRLPQSEQLNNALLAAVKEKSKQPKMCNINENETK